MLYFLNAKLLKTEANMSCYDIFWSFNLGGSSSLLKNDFFYKVIAELGGYNTKLGIWDLVRFCVMQNDFLLVCEIRTKN